MTLLDLRGCSKDPMLASDRLALLLATVASVLLRLLVLDFVEESMVRFPCEADRCDFVFAIFS